MFPYASSAFPSHLFGVCNVHLVVGMLLVSLVTVAIFVMCFHAL